MKKYLLTIAALVLVSGNASAESYNISRIYAGGYEYNVQLNRSATAANGGFSLSIDPVTQTANFKFRVNSEVVNPDTSCQITASQNATAAAAYKKALELQHDIKLIESFYVDTGDGQCTDITQVVYRTDVKRVNFSCDNGSTILGQSVYVSGNTARLGNWTAGGSVKLNPSFYPKWTGDVIVESSTNIQWKCLKHDEITPTQNVVWQAGANNSFNSGSTSAVSAQF